MRSFYTLPGWAQVVIFGVAVLGSVAAAGLAGLAFAALLGALLDIAGEVVAVSDRLARLEEQTPLRDPDDVDWQAWDAYEDT